jgi:cysteine desulfurase
MDSVYLDSAATTQMRPEVVKRMQEVLEENYGNPSSSHAFGRSAKSILENARKTIAKLFNVTPGEIIFTSGGTEADNLALNSAVRDLGVKRIITSKIEHHAVLYTVQQLESQYGIDVDYVNLDENGAVDYKHLDELLENSDEKTLVSLMHVNNEIGNILDIDKVGQMCQEHKALFHSDTVQSIGHFKMDLNETPVDFTAVSAHKFHGPKGAGFAYVKKNSGVKPLIFGGEQEKGNRAGTESVHNIAGMETALKMAYENMDPESTHIQGLKEYFIDNLNKEVPGVKFNGQSGNLEKSTYTVVNACLPISADKATMLLFQLDLKGIACSKGSACQSGSDTGSHVLNNVCCEEDLKRPSIRFSFSKFNTKEELDYVIEVLKEFAEPDLVGKD